MRDGTDIRQARQIQTRDKRETTATDEDTGREERVQIWAFSQSDQSKGKHFAFFPYCDRHLHTSAPEAIFLMHLTDKVLFQPNFRKCMNLARDWKFKIWGFLFVCLLALFEGGAFLFVLFLCQNLLFWL